MASQDVDPRFARERDSPAGQLVRELERQLHDAAVLVALLVDRFETQQVEDFATLARAREFVARHGAER